jgi:sugar/nucleoside kinase (ribokinase family)
MSLRQSAAFVPAADRERLNSRSSLNLNSAFAASLFAFSFQLVTLLSSSMPTRSDIALSAATALSAAPAPTALVGFDGFIDEIIRVVDTRHSMSHDGYTSISTIEQFAARVGSAAGKSTNIELVVHEERFGGNGPLMAGALGRLGAIVTFIGAVGRYDDPVKLHPLYTELKNRCQMVIPVAPPAHTDALEFADGKLMLGKPANVQLVTWDRLKTIVGLDALRTAIASSSLLGIVNWTMLGGVESIWQGLMSEVFPVITQRPRIFIDLSDPAKRTDEDIRRALGLLAQLNTFTPVSLGLNLAEAERIAHVVGVSAFTDSSATLGQTVMHAAKLLREELQLNTVVIHPREGAGGATATDAAWFDGPFTRDPKLSTGAGDHFNGGFALAQTLNMTLAECLAVGCATSGVYVRDALSPTRERLISFLRELPAGING